MEVLLLQDVTGVGKKNDVLVVGDGFALNCLLPQRKALVATPTVRKRYAEQIRKRAEEKEKERNITQAAVTALQGKSVQFMKKATKNGKLYAAISAAEVVTALKDQHGLEVSEEQLVIAEPIKNIGSTQVQVKIGSTSLPVMVIVGQEKEAAAKKAE
jgi:large subunit ribosomal protein L9